MHAFEYMRMDDLYVVSANPPSEEKPCARLPIYIGACVVAITLRCRPEYYERFTQILCARAHAIDHMPGFLGLQILEPTDGTPEYRVITHWKTERDYELWLDSPEFQLANNVTAEDIRLAEAAGEEPPITVNHERFRIMSV
jgi:heme-degrading monooxygenase HmoA